MTSEKIETVWPDESFAQFGGHVIDRLFNTRHEMRELRGRYRVRVTIETFPLGADFPSTSGRGTKGEGLTATVATPLTPALSQREREEEVNG